MNKVIGLNLVFPPDYVNAAAIVSLLSVLVLVCLFFYLNWYTGRRYFSLWTVGWVFYAIWLAIGPGLANVGPFQIMMKHWCVGVAAALLFWGSVQFLEMPSRPVLFGLFIGFLLVWSYVGAYYLRDPLQIRVPIFSVIGLASLVTAFSFYRLRKHREFIGAGLLTFGFVLWGLYLVVCPFFTRDNQLLGTGFLISAVLQLFIAVSMIILVLEEAKAANEMILNQISAFHWEAKELEAGRRQHDADYHGVFDRSSLGEKMRLACADLRETREQSLQHERLEALSQISRGIAHDINNALTPVQGYVSLLLRDSAELPEHVVSYIRSIKTAGDRIAQSVATIRDFYRHPDGMDTLVGIELNELVDEVFESNQSQWRESLWSSGLEVKFEAELDPVLPRVTGQKTELRAAVNELILNALQAMPDGGTLKVRTGMRPGAPAKPGDPPANRTFVEVSDTGVGMDEKARRRCLEPFFSTKTQQGAKGLGLSRVYGIMQRHRGQIEIETGEGKGTVMRLVFAAVESGQTERFYATPKAPDLAPLKILCIDDEPSVLNVLKLILQSGGHNVDVADSGETGLRAFRAARAVSQPFDIVITDLGMPKPDGREVTRLVKHESSQTPVIMLTGWGGILQAEGQRPEFVDAILSKPPQIEELLGAIRIVTSAR